METLDSFTKKIDVSLETAYSEYQTNFDKLVAVRDITTAKLRNLKLSLPRIIDGLAKEHLVVTNVGYYMGDKTLSVTITAKSDGKFRFLKFRGYTSRGSGKNQDALHLKADKLGTNLRISTQIEMYINSASLEVRNQSEEGRALIEKYCPV